jgi:hypothetical protein
MRIVRWRIRTAVVLAGLTGVGLPSLIPWFISQKRLRTAEAVLRVEKEALERLDAPRPVLRGDVLPGNAWEDYREAQACPGVPRDGEGYGASGLVRCGFRADYVGWAEAQIAFDAAGLLAIDRGVHRRDAVVPEDARSMFGGLNRLTMAALARAMIAERRGPALEAAGRWIDLLQFGRDLSRVPYMKDIGYQILLRALAELSGWAERGTLEGEAARAVLDALDRLAAAIPEGGPLVLLVVAHSGKILTRLEPYECIMDEARWIPPAPGWRDLWSQDLLWCRTWDRMLEWNRRYMAQEQAEAGPYAEVQEDIRREIATARVAFPETERRGCAFEPPLENPRACRSLIRFLRTVLQHRPGGPAPGELNGEGLQILHEGGEVIVQVSVGTVLWRFERNARLRLEFRAHPCW